uniref:Threonine synthase n=1 Tax=Fervidicoccus fontis TaxID=683846 RepID=A0A7J3ZJ25_9CREN
MKVEIEDARLICVNCGRNYEGDTRLFLCPKCGGLLDVVLENLEWSPKGHGVWRYGGMLPRPPVEPVTLGEGGTPLVRSRQHSNLYFKLEGANPTGSFKDRGMTLAVTIALYSNAKSLICASTGNTAASAAAYAARAGLTANIVLPYNAVARGKILQAIAYGARILWISGSFDDAIRHVMKIVELDSRHYPMNSFNPWRLEGQKTIVFEIHEALSRVDNIIYPVGNGGNIAAAGKAISELLAVGVIGEPPRLIGVQAEGAAPLADAFERGLDRPVFYESPKTVASAIRIGRPVNWSKALRAVKSTRGAIIKVSDQEIINAQKVLGWNEGLLVEPASSAAYAGYLKALEQRLVDKTETTVVVLTGSGLKDPESLSLIRAREERVVEGELQQLLSALNKGPTPMSRETKSTQYPLN